jgi:beta-lactamase class D
MLNRVFYTALLSLGVCYSSFASGLQDHFKGRYGAIELFDTQKKLSFRVNAPELSAARDFCEFHHLSTAIAAIEIGLLSDFSADVMSLSNANPAPQKTLSLRQAIRKNQTAVFGALNEKIGAAKLQSMHAAKLLPSGGEKISAFALLEWFKALESNTLKLKPNTLAAIRSMLAVSKPNGAKLLSFSSRCKLEYGALGGAVGVLQRPKMAPVYFAISVDGKTRKDLFGIAPGIRDASLSQMGYFDTDSARPIRR